MTIERPIDDDDDDLVIFMQRHAHPDKPIEWIVDRLEAIHNADIARLEFCQRLLKRNGFGLKGKR